MSNFVFVEAGQTKYGPHRGIGYKTGKRKEIAMVLFFHFKRF